MLKLVFNRDTANQNFAIDETENDPSHQFISQAKYAYLEEVWNARFT